MKNIKVTQRQGEDRKDYLIRVAGIYLKHVDHTSHFMTHYPETINYDQADCYGSCLADDIEMEFPSIDFEDFEEI